MRRVLTPGAYAPGATVVHRLDPRAKLVCLLASSVAAFAAPAPWGLAVVALGLVATLVASRTSPATVLRGLRALCVGRPGCKLKGTARGFLLPGGRVPEKGGVHVHP